jgi:hypothetical protein
MALAQIRLGPNSPIPTFFPALSINSSGELEDYIVSQSLGFRQPFESIDNVHPRGALWLLKNYYLPKQNRSFFNDGLKEQRWIARLPQLIG